MSYTSHDHEYATLHTLMHSEVAVLIHSFPFLGSIGQVYYKKLSHNISGYRSQTPDPNPLHRIKVIRRGKEERIMKLTMLAKMIEKRTVSERRQKEERG